MVILNIAILIVNIILYLMYRADVSNKKKRDMESVEQYKQKLKERFNA